MSEQNLVRAGNRRLALRGTFVSIFVVGLLLLASSGRASELYESWRAPQLTASQDTTRLAQLLAKVRGLDPTICQLVRRAIDNRFGNWYGGSFMHDPAGVAADDLLSGWDSKAGLGSGVTPMLRRSLSDADACVRHTSAQLLGRSQSIDLADELRAELGSTNTITRE